MGEAMVRPIHGRRDRGERAEADADDQDGRGEVEERAAELERRA
jgi:hypothetical protein